jgi:hypothetical protein
MLIAKLAGLRNVCIHNPGMTRNHRLVNQLGTGLLFVFLSLLTSAFAVSSEISTRSAATNRSATSWLRK